MEICPNCGKEATFISHGAYATGGEPDERWFEVWLTCSECGAPCGEKEIIGPDND